jgi:hypothetical protein
VVCGRRGHAVGGWLVGGRRGRAVGGRRGLAVGGRRGRAVGRARRGRLLISRPLPGCLLPDRPLPGCLLPGRLLNRRASSVMCTGWCRPRRPGARARRGSRSRRSVGRPRAPEGRRDGEPQGDPDLRATCAARTHVAPPFSEAERAGPPERDRTVTG